MRHPLTLLPLIALACAPSDSTDEDTDVEDTDGTGETDDTDETEDTDVADDTEPPAPTCGDLGILCTVVGELGIAQFGAEDVPASESQLYLPVDMTVAPDGQLYVIDFNNHRLRRVAADGKISTFAGTGFLGDGPEGNARAAAFNHPTDLVFHPDDPDLLYVAAWHNSRIETIALDVDPAIVSFECGNGARTWAGDGGPAATAAVDLPSSIAFDSARNLYISDQASQVIRRVNPEGIISTIAGRPPYSTTTPPSDYAPCASLAPGASCYVRQQGWSGDGGPASEALFRWSPNQAADPGSRLTIVDDVLYVADTLNHVIRKIDLETMIITHVAGTGTVPGTGGDGGPATEGQLNTPSDVEVDVDGSLFIADTYNHCVRKIDPDGILSTVAGICGEGANPNEGRAYGDGGPATEAHLLRPYGVEISPDGILYIADSETHTIRAVRVR